MKTLWQQEPVAVLGVVQAGLAVLVGFGVHINSTQFGLLMAFTSAIGAVIARTQVTPK